MSISSTSLALQAYEPPVRDRRVHLDDLSGVLELMIIASVLYALRSLRRRELSLAQFTHTISMFTLLFIGGHFVEEHMLGVRKLEGLLKFGFQALSEDYSTPPRSGIISLFRGIWELSGVFVGCGGLMYTRLWKCDVQNPECCPSCIASSSSISAGQGLAGNGCGPVHLKCRLLRARLYMPIFCTWWILIIIVIGSRFNSLLGGSAIRPANDAYYFLSVLRSSPFVGVATIGATLSVWLMAELMDAEAKPQVNETYRVLAMEMEKDDIMRSLLGQQLQRSDTFSSAGHPNSSRVLHIPETQTPVHASSYQNPVSGGSFFVDEQNKDSAQHPHPGSSSSYPASSPSSTLLDPVTPSWGVPNPSYQQPPASFTQSTIQNMNDFEKKAAQAEAEAFAWARQQSAQHQKNSGLVERRNWSVLDEQLSRSVRTPPIDSQHRSRMPPASAPILNGHVPTSSNVSNIGSASSATSARVKVPPSFAIFKRGEGDVSHLISSDSEDDEGDGDEDRRAHAAMGLGMYEDLEGPKKGTQSGVWSTGPASPLMHSTKPIPRSSSNGSLNRSPSPSSLGEHDSIPLSSPTGSSTLPRRDSFDTSLPETPTLSGPNISAATSPRNGSSSYSPASKKAALNAATAALQHGGASGRPSYGEQPTSPLNPVNLASRSSFDLANSTSPSSSPRQVQSEKGLGRGRPENRSRSPFIDRPSSLTRSNADSSEESEDETDDEDEEVFESNKSKDAPMIRLGSDESLQSQHSNSSGSHVLSHKPPIIGSVDRQGSQSSDVSIKDMASTGSRSDTEKSEQSDGSSPSSVVSLAKNGWKRFVDESSGAPYWFNENSGESSWTKPNTTMTAAN